jgi:DNA-binding NtrC family response regulator
MLLAKGERISLDDIPDEIRIMQGQEILESEKEENNQFEKYLLREMENFTARLVLMARSEKKGAQEEIDDESPAKNEQSPYRNYIKSQTAEVEKRMIEKILEECRGNITHAAKRLGFSRKGLQIKIAKYNLRKK